MTSTSNKGFFGRDPHRIGRDSEEDWSVEDSHLQVVDEETFERAQKKIERVWDRYSNAIDDTDEIRVLIDEFWPRTVIDVLDCIVVRCPDCGG